MQLSITESATYTIGVPARRRFCVIYSEWDGSLCRAEGRDDMEAHHALRTIVPPKHWGTEDEFRAALGRWMKEAKPGAMFVPGGKAAVICTK